MALYHECDRCDAKVKGKLFQVTVKRSMVDGLMAISNDGNDDFSFEICNDCRAELRFFKEGCSISQSYRRGPRGSAQNAQEFINDKV